MSKRTLARDWPAVWRAGLPCGPWREKWEHNFLGYNFTSCSDADSFWLNLELGSLKM